MKINQAGIDLIKRSEGIELKAYLCPANVWTIGYGSTHGVRKGMRITKQQAEDLLRKDLVQYETAVERAVKVKLTPNQHAALVSLCYNIGAGAFAKSTLVKRLNAGDVAGAGAQFARWNRGGGKVWPGLVTRRAAERALFLTKGGASAPTPTTPAKTGFFAFLIRLFTKEA